MTDNANTNTVGISASCGNEPNPPPEGKVASQREVSDDQILAAATAIRESSVAWAKNPEQFAHLIELTPAEIRKLIAALASPTEQASDVSGLVEAARKAHAACQSAWSCGEPEHRVKTMLDRHDDLGKALAEYDEALFQAQQVKND